MSRAEQVIAERLLCLALLTKVLVITGGPGVGKTPIVSSILRILLEAVLKLGFWVDGRARM